MQLEDVNLTASQSDDLVSIITSVASQSGEAFYNAITRSKSLVEICELFSSDSNLIALSRLEYPAVVYKTIRNLMAVTNSEYEHVFKHTWRSVSDKDAIETVHRSFSERLLFLLRIFIQGILVFGSLEKTRAWLDKYNPVLEGKPKDLIDTITGCQKVSDELGRIEHGILA